MYDNDPHMYQFGFLLKTKAQQAPEVSTGVRSWNLDGAGLKRRLKSFYHHLFKKNDL